jgi:hypothetical protein
MIVITMKTDLYKTTLNKNSDSFFFVLIIVYVSRYYTGYFTSGSEPDEIENATHNTFAKLT